MQQVKRWNVLVASTAILLCIGTVYAFSVFARPLSELKGWAMGDIMIAFTISMAIGPIPTILGGYFADKGWVKRSIGAGALLFCGSFIVTGYADTLTGLYIGYGIMCGFGQGLVYSGCLSNTIRLFPDKRGLASGIITAGMGGAAIIAAPVANSLIASHDVLYAFRTLGITYLIVALVALCFIRPAPANFKPAGWNPPAHRAAAPTTDKNWVEMIKTPTFYLIVLMLGIGAFSGLMIASQASVIGQNMFGLDPATAALYVSLYALSNCLGRVLWGAVSDKLGRENTLFIIYGVIALALLLLATFSSQLGFAVGVIGLGLCFGGVMGVFPPIVMENYGPANQGVNYGVVFLGYSIAAFFAPKLAADIGAQNNGDFSQAFYIAISLALIGFVINFIYKRVKHLTSSN